jgi:hypothetical protein
VHDKEDGLIEPIDKDSRVGSSKNKSARTLFFLNNFRLGLDGLGVRPLDGRVNFFRAT